MKKVEGFWGSLEQYMGKVIARSPLSEYWRHLGIGLVLVVVVSSAASAKNSVVGATSLEAVVEKAARLGDYETARKLWSESMSDLEDAVYPERKVERRIAELEGKLEEYPGNRQIYLGLADLYEQLAGTRVDAGVDPYKDKAEEYREKARILDPNN